MGAAMSEEERREERRRERESIRSDVGKFKCPDVKVNQTIMMYSSIYSSDNLQEHLNKMKQRNYPYADWMKKLAEKLANLPPNPKLAGLGALAIAVFIDIISSTSSSDTTKNALRCVFAEEKASEVWDQIDECLKRCMMNINDDKELTSDIKRIECQLSAALTKLKNSMVRDGHMSSQALKAWVNGAAFHIQMLIHLVRLGGIQSCGPVEKLLSVYLNDLDLLFRKHEEAVEEKCRMRTYCDPEILISYFENEEGEMCDADPYSYRKYFECYYEEQYISQKYKIRKYFEKVRDDLPKLVRQVGHLSVC